MPDRRQFLTFVGVTMGLAPVAAWFGRGQPVTVAGSFAVNRTDAEWRVSLSPERYRVLRAGGTEWAFSSALNDEKRPGTFSCGACAHPLFSSDTKYDSGTGWPSFWAPIEGAVATSVDRFLVILRTEVHCARCGSHLGHRFADGPRPTGERYCINGIALSFTADA
jgi:peptide-methionine (R)-S-oxide reductase